MHPNLIVFKDQAAAEKWVREARYILAREEMDVVVVRNPTEGNEARCSLLFKPAGGE